MKKLLFLLWLFPAGSLFSQQYQVVHDHLPAYYGSVDIQAFAVDSSAEFSAYTVYYCFGTIRDTSIWNVALCLDAEAGGIMGRVIVQGSGKTSIVNFEGDSLHYFSQTVVGEHPVFYTYPNGNYIEATHFQNSFEDVLGVMDSVKIFRLQVFDSGGDSLLNHEKNGLTFKLSQNFGLLNPIDNYRFPFNSYQRDLSGFSNPVTGVHGVDWRDVFDFSLSDEFHIREKYSYWAGIDSVATKISVVTDKIRIVVGRENFADSVRYTFLECARIITYAPTPVPVDTSFVADTLLEETVKKYPSQEWMDLYPGQLFKEEDNSYSAVNQNNMDKYNGRAEKYIRYQSVMGDTCLNTDYFPENIDFFYVDGCGGPYYTYYFASDLDGHKLLYFKKGSEEWGTPLARDCEDLLSSTDEYFSTQIAPVVYPNPFSGRLTVSSGDGIIEQIHIYNLTGSLQTSFGAGNRTAVVNTSRLPAGVYVLEIRMASGGTYWKKIIKK